MGDPVYFLLHVPKCAGTTVERHFERTLGERFMIAPRWESSLRLLVGNRYRFPPGALDGVAAVSGHSLSDSLKAHFPGREVRECVLLRDPVGYLISFYNYRHDRAARGDAAPPDFETWYATQRRNPISRFLLHRYFGVGLHRLYAMSSADRLAFLEARFARFHFVGGHRRCDEMVAAISRDLGVDPEVEHRNVTERKAVRREDLGGALLDRIAEENAVDVALHDRWRERGFDGAPAGPQPALPKGDGPSYIVSDTASAIRRARWRR